VNGVSEFTEPKKWLPNSSGLNTVDYSMWEQSLQLMVYRQSSQNFRNSSAEMRANRLYGSGKSGRFEPAIDQLPKRLMMVIKAMGAHVEFSLD